MAYASMGYVDAVKGSPRRSACRCPNPPAHAEEAARKEREPDLYAVMEKAMNFYRGELKKSPRAIEYLKSAGSRARSPRATASATRPMTGRHSGRIPNYEDKALAEVGLIVQNDEASATTAFATASCSRSSTRAAR